MSSLFELLNSQLSGDNLAMISRELGADESSTKSGIGAAIPMLVGALSRNGANAEGAQGILNAIEKDKHDGSLFDDLSGFLNNQDYEQPRSGAGILGHVLGEKQERVNAGISQISGLSADSTDKLLKMLAPMIMGALGKQQKSKGLGVDDLMGLLGGEKKSIESHDDGGLVGRLLDQDGDGDFDISDMAKMAGKLFG